MDEIRTDTRGAEAARQAEPAAGRAPVDSPAAAGAGPQAVGQGVSLRGISVADAVASVGSRNNIVTSIVMGGDSSIAQIRVVDAVTHQVIAESPPDTIARMQDEMLAYQQVARNGLR